MFKEFDQYMKLLYKKFLLSNKKDFGEDTSIYGITMHYFNNKLLKIYKMPKRFIKELLN